MKIKLKIEVICELELDTKQDYNEGITLEEIIENENKGLLTTISDNESPTQTTIQIFNPVSNRLLAEKTFIKDTLI